jgi:hypothetical protein
LDAFSLLALVFWFYVAAISLVLGAMAITHEREQKTWDQLRVTALSKRERAVGFLWGRLGPVWASALVTAGLWWLLQPSYSALLATYLEPQTSRGALALGSLVTLGLALLAGEIGLLASARSKSTAAAVALAVMMAAPFAFTGWLILCTDLYLGWRNVHPSEQDQQLTTANLVFLGIFIMVSAGIWESLENRLDRI